MMRLEKGLKRQAVLDQGVAGARETGEAVSEKRLLHSRWPRQIGKIANGEIDLPGFQRILEVPGSHYRRAKVYPGRILRQPGDHAGEKQRFADVRSRDRVGPNFRRGIESSRIQYLALHRRQHPLNRLFQRQSAGCWLHAVSRAYEEFVLEDLPQLSQRTANRRLTHVQGLGCIRKGALAQHAIEHEQEVEIEVTEISHSSRLPQQPYYAEMCSTANVGN